LRESLIFLAPYIAQEPKTKDKPPSIGVAFGGNANNAVADKIIIPVRSAADKKLRLFIIYKFK
jgi:hypothetical protein